MADQDTRRWTEAPATDPNTDAAQRAMRIVRADPSSNGALRFSPLEEGS